MEQNNLIEVPGRLHPVDKDKILCSTEDIWDEALGKRQSEVNAGIEETVAGKVDEAIANSVALTETVENKVTEKVPQVVAQALNDAVMPAVQEAVQGVQNQVTALQEQVDNLQPGTSTDNNTTYKISLNGEVKGDSNGVDLGTVYAPATSGNRGQILQSSGAGSAPQWVNAPSNSGLTEEQVVNVINQEIYGGEKPEGASVVTSENILDKFSDAIDNSASIPEAENPFVETIGNIVNNELYGSSEKPEGGYVITNQNFSEELSKSGASEGGMTQEQVTTLINQTLYGSDDKPQDAAPVTTENLESTLSGYLKSEDISSWAKENNKPGYDYGEIGYNISKVSSEGGAVTLDATVPVHEITASAHISGITFANNTVPEDGHSCHVIVKAAETLSVSIADGATMATVGETSYLSVCPESSDISLNITAGGYVEFDLFRIGENIYIRGI